jgi:hypothetical protein
MAAVRLQRANDSLLERACLNVLGKNPETTELTPQTSPSRSVSGRGSKLQLRPIRSDNISLS